MEFKPSGITFDDDHRERWRDTLHQYRDHLRSVVDSGDYEDHEASVNLPDDRTLRERVNDIVSAHVDEDLAYIIVIGIGGSNLGTMAVYDALYGTLDHLEPERFPKLIFVDTVNARELERLHSFIHRYVTSPREVLVTSISKSGGTTETVANTELVYSYLSETFGPDITDRFIAITDEGSKLWDRASETGMSVLPIPAQVGGRYSVLSAVGLMPLAAAGIDIDALHAGARDAREPCITHDLDKNSAMRSALAIHQAMQRGVNIHDTFLYHTELESLGKWYRQLTGESLGKEEDQDGKQVFAGITPTVSIGSTDLHSVAQLYLGGPKDKVTTFVRARDTLDTSPIPHDGLVSPLTAEAQGYTADQIMDAIYEGVKIAYEKQELPYMEIFLDDISAHSIGAFLQFKMIEIMYLAQLMNVNAFNQPNVELYKTETKRILEEG